MRAHYLCYFGLREESKNMKVLLDLLIRCIQEILMYLLNRGLFWVQEQCISLTFAKLLAAFSQQKWHSDPISFIIGLFPNQITSIRNVAPLITSTELKHALLLFEQSIEVIGLDDGIRKFCIWNAFLWLEPVGYGLSTQQRPHSEVFANITQVSDRVHIPIKIIIILDLKGTTDTLLNLFLIYLIQTMILPDILLNVIVYLSDLLWYCCDVSFYYFLVKQRSFLGFSAGIAYQACGSSDQENWLQS